MEDSTYSYADDISINLNKSCDINVSETLTDLERLRISALTKAAEISPLVTEVTIGPRSPSKKTPNADQMPSTNNEEFIDLIEDKLGEDLRYTLLLKNYEAQLQENAEGLYKNLIDNMITTYAKTMQRFLKKQSDEYKRKALELRARKLQTVKLLQDKFNLSLVENVQLDEKKCQMINQQAIENMNRILDEKNKATSRFDSITDSHTKICLCYEEITKLIETEPQMKDILDKYVLEINTIIQEISSIMEFRNASTITDTEVQQSEILSLNIENIKQRISEDLEILKHQEYLRKQKEDEEAKQKELEARKALEAEEAEKIHIQKTLIEQAKRAQSIFFSEKNFIYYEELKNFLDSYESSYKDLLENTNLKKFRFDCQKAVNTPINALSSASGVHIRDKYDKLSKLLSGVKVQVLDTYVMASQHPQGVKYCTALLAKKIVRQGDLLVSSNHEAAFPLAAVTVALWSQFPEFGKLLEAYFHKFCPYLVPMMLPQKEGQSDKEFYISRGYTYNDEGVVEKQDKFLKRMSGIFRLHCAIWIANTPKFIDSFNPCGLHFAWKWLASFINLKPEPDISATLLHDFFAVCGSQFLKYYGKQCIKIIKVINSEYLSILDNIDEGGPKTRLEVFLANILKTGIMPPPSGLLPLNTW